MKTDRAAENSGSFKAAATLLNLLADYSPDELRAAARIIGGAPELVEAIQLLCAFREQHHRGMPSAARRGESADGAAEPRNAPSPDEPTGDRSLSAGLGAGDQARLVRARMADEQHRLHLAARSTAGLKDRGRGPTRLPEAIEELYPEETLRNMVVEELSDDRITYDELACLPLIWKSEFSPKTEQPRNTLILNLLTDFEQHFPSPAARKVWYLRILREIAESTDHKERNAALLRRMIIDSLADNELLFPDLFQIAELRQLWRPDKPLPYSPNETRRHLAERLVQDAERVVPKEQLDDTLLKLLERAMARPSDGPIAMMRRMDSQHTDRKKRRAG